MGLLKLAGVLLYFTLLGLRIIQLQPRTLLITTARDKRRKQACMDSHRLYLEVTWALPLLGLRGQHRATINTRRRGNAGWHIPG